MFKDLAIALSLSNMLFASVWIRFFYKERFLLRYLPNTNSYLALIGNILIFALIFWLVIKLIRRLNNRLVWNIAKTLLCLIVLCFAYMIFGSKPLIRNLLLLLAIFLAVRRIIVKAALKAALLAAPFVLIIIAQATWGAFQDYGHSNVIPVKPLFAKNPATPRVLWLIFDETDQRITFSKRPSSLQIPEFDRFKSQALFARNAYPPADYTIRSLPALIDGKIITHTNKSGASTLLITYDGSKHPVNWGSGPNLFSRARAARINTALIGEYLPYSRLIGKDLTYCSWSAYRYDFGSQSGTILSNMSAQIYGVFVNPALVNIQHKRAYDEIFAETKKIVVDRNYDLILVHFPIPHLPAITDKPWSNPDKSIAGYLHNLRLADATLGEIRRELEANALWDKTNIIISSDHWLRGSSPDKRVPFLVKLAGQTDPVDFKSAFNTVVTHDLILSVLSKEITNHSELQQWLKMHLTEPLNPHERYVPVQPQTETIPVTTKPL